MKQSLPLSILCNLVKTILTTVKRLSSCGPWNKGWYQSTILISVLLSQPLSAASTCQALFKNSVNQPHVKKQLKGTRLWNSQDSIRIRASNGEMLALTFSFDAEISMRDYWTILFSESESLKAVDAFERLTQPISKPILLQILKMSEKQFGFFALRAGVDSNKTSFFITDFKPGYMDSLWNNSAANIDSKMYISPNINPHIAQYFTPAVRKRFNLPIKAERDGWAPEVQHESSEESPAEYAQSVQRLHKAMPSAQTHFHLGIPADTVTKAQVAAIARATELRIILRMLTNWREHINAPSSKYVDSAFHPESEENSVGRGFVRLTHHRFTTPTPAHDLEIRQWESPRDGLATVELAVILLESKDQLITVKMNVDDRYSLDSRFGNVRGALRYLSEILKNHQGYREASIELGQLISGMKRQQHSSDFENVDNSFLEKAEIILNKYGLAGVEPQIFLNGI